MFEIEKYYYNDLIEQSRELSRKSFKYRELLNFLLKKEKCSIPRNINFNNYHMIEKIQIYCNVIKDALIEYNNYEEPKSEGVIRSYCDVVKAGKK